MIDRFFGRFSPNRPDKFSFDIEVQRLFVDIWMEENIGLIIDLMLRRIEDSRKERKNDDPHLATIDFNLRTLSEMPLCNVWRQLTPPLGFEIAPINSSKAYKYDASLNELSFLAWHMFARDEWDNDLCLTAGQFPDKQFPGMLPEITQPGDRLRIYQDKAPHLFRTFEHNGYQLTRLFGPSKEIKNTLGLCYRMV